MKKTIIYGALSVFAAFYMTGCSDTMPSESEENIQLRRITKFLVIVQKKYLKREAILKKKLVLKKNWCWNC